MRKLVIIASVLLLFLSSCATVSPGAEEDSRELAVAGDIGNVSGGITAATGMGSIVEGSLDAAVTAQDDINVGVASAIAGSLNAEDAAVLTAKVNDQTKRLVSALAVTKLLNAQLTSVGKTVGTLGIAYADVVKTKNREIQDVKDELSKTLGELGLVKKWLAICASILVVMAIVFAVKIIRRFI